MHSFIPVPTTRTEQTFSPMVNNIPHAILYTLRSFLSSPTDLRVGMGGLASRSTAASDAPSTQYPQANIGNAAISKRLGLGTVRQSCPHLDQGPEVAAAATVTLRGGNGGRKKRKDKRGKGRSGKSRKRKSRKGKGGHGTTKGNSGTDNDGAVGEEEQAHDSLEDGLAGDGQEGGERVLMASKTPSPRVPATPRQPTTIQHGAGAPNPGQRRTLQAPRTLSNSPRTPRQPPRAPPTPQSRSLTPRSPGGIRTAATGTSAQVEGGLLPATPIYLHQNHPSSLALGVPTPPDSIGTSPRRDSIPPHSPAIPSGPAIGGKGRRVPAVAPMRIPDQNEGIGRPSEPAAPLGYGIVDGRPVPRPAPMRPSPAPQNQGIVPALPPTGQSDGSVPPAQEARPQSPSDQPLPTTDQASVDQPLALSDSALSGLISSEIVLAMNDDRASNTPPPLYRSFQTPPPDYYIPRPGQPPRRLPTPPSPAPMPVFRGPSNPLVYRRPPTPRPPPRPVVPFTPSRPTQVMTHTTEQRGPIIDSLPGYGGRPEPSTVAVSRPVRFGSMIPGRTAISEGGDTEESSSRSATGTPGPPAAVSAESDELTSTPSLSPSNTASPPSPEITDQPATPRLGFASPERGESASPPPPLPPP
ncbi:hypothetical protein B0T22DRAFT_116931 [Podospora appendiculata]|uniref:Uncharacterized protein n=1 Tax=Podospora appendiculata TaxID=314037 RepID=A0AAE0XM53_9PEZI|nr:hypothetical protein B0T22DRAFT_116931 [Podospora appendiculata]